MFRPKQLRLEGPSNSCSGLEKSPLTDIALSHNELRAANCIEEMRREIDELSKFSENNLFVIFRLGDFGIKITAATIDDEELSLSCKDRHKDAPVKKSYSIDYRLRSILGAEGERIVPAYLADTQFGDREFSQSHFKHDTNSHQLVLGSMPISNDFFDAFMENYDPKKLWTSTTETAKMFPNE